MTRTTKPMCMLMLASILLLYLSFSNAFSGPRTRYITPIHQHLSSPLHLYWGSDDDNTPINNQDRFKSCIPYLLPLLDLDPFSHYICLRSQSFSYIHDFFFHPLLQLFQVMPWLPILLFLLFTLGSRSATYLHRRVRFNAQQAALIDVALALPQDFVQVYSTANHDGIPSWMEETCCNTIFITFAFMLGYCIYYNVRGKKPVEIPWISDVAQLMTGPY